MAEIKIKYMGVSFLIQLKNYQRSLSLSRKDASQNINRLTFRTLIDCLISSSFFSRSLIRCFNSDLFFPSWVCKPNNKIQSHFLNSQAQLLYCGTIFDFWVSEILNNNQWCSPWLFIYCWVMSMHCYAMCIHNLLWL